MATKSYGVRRYVRRLCDELGECDLSMRVARFGNVASCMVEGEDALFLDDDIAPGSDGSDGGESDGADGALPNV